MADNEYWIRRNGSVLGPFSSKQVKAGAKSGKLAPSDEISNTETGPWTNLSKALQPKGTSGDAPPEVHPSPPLTSAPSSHSANPANVSPIVSVAGPPARLVHPEVHQLDVTQFLVENVPKPEVFERLKSAIAINHTITGAFPRSWLIRGTGPSGIVFAVQLSDHEDGIAFQLDGETPEGPTNFQAWFNPTTAAGWGLFAVTQVFNSAVNNTSQRNVSSDYQLLLINLLSAFDAQHLINGQNQQAAGTSPSIVEIQDARTLSDGTSELANYICRFKKLGQNTVHNTLIVQLPKDQVMDIVERTFGIPSESAFQQCFGKTAPTWQAVKHVKRENGAITGAIPASMLSWGYTVTADITPTSQTSVEITVTLKSNTPIDVNVGKRAQIEKSLCRLLSVAFHSTHSPGPSS